MTKKGTQTQVKITRYTVYQRHILSHILLPYTSPHPHPLTPTHSCYHHATEASLAFHTTCNKLRPTTTRHMTKVKAHKHKSPWGKPTIPPHLLIPNLGTGKEATALATYTAQQRYTHKDMHLEEKGRLN